MLRGGGADPHLAFTLAEVLITLGIIGVVAAMTMPALISNHKKQVYVTQLKKVVNTAINGCKMAMAKNETTSLTQTDLWQALTVDDSACEGGYCSEANIQVGVPASAPSIIKKYFEAEVSDELVCTNLADRNNKPYSSCRNGSITFKDGSAITDVYSTRSSSKYGSTYQIDYVIRFTVDVNGVNKLPNKAGLDQFIFYINDMGGIYTEYPGMSQDDLKRMCIDYDSAPGEYCFQLVVEDGWKINYL